MKYEKDLFAQKCLLCATLLLSFVSAYAEMRTEVREYTYQASEDDSKKTAREKSIANLEAKFLREIAGSYVSSNVSHRMQEDESGLTEESRQTTKSRVFGHVKKTEVLEEKWDGEKLKFYIRARLTVDEDELKREMDAYALEERRRRDASANDKKLASAKTKSEAHLFNPLNYTFWTGLGLIYNGFYHSNANVSQSALATAILGRYGGTIGWGWEAQLGGVIAPTKRDQGIYLSMAAKIYPYKSVYVAAQGAFIGNHTLFEYAENGHFSINKQMLGGISVLLGFDYVKSDNNACYYAGVGGGITYSPFLKMWIPSVRIGLGVGMGSFKSK